MRFSSCLWIVLAVLLWTPLAPASPPAVEEFAVPLQGATPRSTPRSADRARLIKKDSLTGEPALQAKTAQIAIGAAIGQKETGCRLIRFGSGFGWVITGSAAYQTPDNNPVAVRRSRQNARFKAFTEARTQWYACLRALAPEAQQKITDHLEQEDAIRLALINLAASDTEKRDQALRILARGFVAYAVEDQPAPPMIRVHLVATPRTATRLSRPTANSVETLSLQEGLRQVLAEIQAGLIPPVGHRLMVVNATGELALVGYAINLVGVHPDPTAQIKLRADAEKIASTQATEALIGLATGDDARWQHRLDEVSQTEIRTVSSGYDDNEASARRFAQIRDLVMATAKDDPGLQALQEGKLPEAAAIKHFAGEDAMVVAVVYTPTVRKPAAMPLPAPTPSTTEPPTSTIPAVPEASATPAPTIEPPTGAVPTAETAPPEASR